MKVHKFKNDPQVLLEQGKRILREESSDQKFTRRVLCVNILLSGTMGTKELAEISGFSMCALQNWLKSADANGWDSLRDTPIPGRTPTLTDEQVQEIRKVVLEDPSLKNYEVWDGISLADYIRKTYHVSYSVSSAQRLMHRMGLVLRRPTTMPSLAPSDAEIAEFIHNKLIPAHNDPSRVLVFGDQVKFQAQSNVTRVWVPKGCNPVVLSKPGRENVSYNGFVIPDSGRLYTYKPETFNYSTIIDGFRSFLAEAPALPEGVRYCVVLDNAPWHKKAVRLIWGDKLADYQDIRDRMCYLFLPPYCPMLNVIEQVWRITRAEVTHNRYVGSVKDRESALDGYFALYKEPNEKFQSLCSFVFSEPDDSGNMFKVKNGKRRVKNPAYIVYGKAA